MSFLRTFSAFILLLPIAAVDALVLSPSARVSYVHGAWTKTISQASDSGSNDKYTVIHPTTLNVSETDAEGWEWTSADSEPPSVSREQDSLIHVAKIELQCDAPYPIEWIYEGDGWSEKNEAILRRTRALEDVTVQNSRSTRSRSGSSSQTGERRSSRSESDSDSTPVDDSKSEHFISRITGLRLYELISGSYKCRSVAFPEVFVNFNIFVPNNTVTVFNNGDSSTAPVVIPLLQRTFLLESSQTIWFNEEDAQVRLPCSVSDPTAIVTLHELYDDGSDSGIRVELPFDPRKGFFVPSSHISWKRYKCSAKERKKSLEVFLFRESASKTPYFSVAPKDTIVLLKANQTQNFRCEGYRPISIETSTGGGNGASSSSCGLGTVRTHYSFHAQNHYPYRALVEMNATTTARASGSGTGAGAFMDIVCRTEDGQQALHTWEVIRHDTTGQTWMGLQLKFDQTRRQFPCCSGSGRKPNLRVIQCGSPIECRMRRQYHLRLRPHEPYTPKFETNFSDHCVALSFPDDRVTEGLLICRAGTQSKESFFIYNGVTKAGALLPPGPGQQWAPTSNSTNELSLNALREKARTAQTSGDEYGVTESYMLPLGEIYLGQDASFKCEVPTQIFATDDESVIWGFKYRNGTPRQIQARSGSRDGGPGVEALLEFDDLSIEAVTCQVPLLRSFDWVTLDTPVEVKPIAAKVAPTLEFRHSKNAAVTSAEADDRSLVLNLAMTTLAGQRQGGGGGGLSEVRLELICQAEYPVEWVYKAGEGSPVLIQANTRRDLDTDNFAATLVLGALEQNTGRYECRRTNDHTQSAYYDVYVPGLSLFMRPATAGEREIRLRESMAENSNSSATWFRVPCAVSNPSAQVKLMLLDREKNTWSFLASSKQGTATATAGRNQAEAEATFSTLLGFNVSSKIMEIMTASQKQDGLVFKCLSVDGRRSSANFTLSQQRNDENSSSLISASPRSHFVQAAEQHFECKSSVEIKIRFRGMSGRNFSAYNVTYVHDPASATYTAAFTLALGRGGGLDRENYTHVQCVEKKTDKLLYYWEYTVYSYDPHLITSFKYNAETRAYECCARDGATTTPPELFFLPCGTVTECRIQKACLARAECRNLRARMSVSLVATESACASIQVSNTSAAEPAPVSGVLQCAVNGFMSRESKTYMFYTDGLNYEVHTDKGTLGLDLGSGIPTSAALKIRFGAGAGFRSRIECYASKMFFADGLLFVLEYANGSLVHQKSDERLSPTTLPSHAFEYSASLTLQTQPLPTLPQTLQVEPDTNLASVSLRPHKIYCFASNWKSSKWSNTSISISEQGHLQVT